MNKKRGPNQGSVYRRGSDGRWVAQVTHGGKHRLAYFSTQSEAKRFLAYALLELRQGRPIQTRQVPLGLYLETWLDWLAPALRPKTRLHYQHAFQHHLLPVLGRIPLQDLQPAQIQSLYQAKRQAGTSDRMIQLLNSLLHHALEEAVRSGLILANPVNGIPKPRYRAPERPVQAAAQAIEQVTGRPPIIGGGGGCDLRLPVLYGGTPAVIYGPRGGMVHCVDEYVEFQQVMTCIQVLARLAVAWCGTQEL